jgi:hypothetical protein
MDVLDKLSDEALVREFCDFLSSPPNSWHIVSRGEDSLQYRIADYSFSLQFKEGWKYHLRIERAGKEVEMWGEVPYSQPNRPNIDRLFEENMDLARRILTNSK